MNAFALAAKLEGFTLDARASWSAPSAALFGASGSGKTTIVETIAGLRHDVEGEVSLLARRLDALPARERRVGWVPQDAALFPHRTVAWNLDFAIEVRGDRVAARRAIDALEIGHLLERRASELSGGERQRVAIARALASTPDFLLLDEPLASIDRPLRARIVPFLDRLRRDLAIPYLLVTHDPLEVLALADEVLVLESGRIAAQGDPREVFASAAAFGALHALGAENVFPIAVVSRGDGTRRVRTPAGLELEMSLVPGFDEPTRIAIRSEDVMLAVEQPHGLSAQNVIESEVVALEPIGGAFSIDLQVHGEMLRARLTAAAVTRLALAPGARVWIVLKAHAIHAL